MFVRTATPGDALDVRRILDAAALEPGDVEARTAAGDVLVAGDRPKPSEGPAAAGSDGSEARERLLGAAVLEPREHEHGARVTAIGVRRRHRNRGIGRLLIEQALTREGALTARFDGRVRPFYESLEFSIEPIGEDRFRGVRRR